MISRRVRFGSVVALGVAVLAWGLPSEAFRMTQRFSGGRVTSGDYVPCDDPGGFTHWGLGNHAIGWRLNSDHQGAGKEEALHSAMVSWSYIPATNYLLYFAGYTTAGFATDGINTIRFGVGDGCSGDCLALTALVLQGGQVIIESDITFNNSQTWRTSGADIDTEAVAAHEFGHSLGIGHSEASGVPTMKSGYAGLAKRSLENDDRQALQCSELRYGSPPPVPVLSATPTSGIGPLTVTFDGSLSYDPNGSVTQWYWDFGDGGGDSGPVVTHTYPMDPYGPQTFTAQLIVYDDDGQGRSTTQQILVLCDSGLYCPQI